MKIATLLLAIFLPVALIGCGQETEWFVDSPKNLSPETIKNDVWHWYHMETLEPSAIQRVEWNTTPVLGSKRWGYFLYYKGRIKNSELLQSVKQGASQWERYSGLPAWAKHIPNWWTPEVIIPSELSVEIVGFQGLAFANIVGDDVFVYCLKKPLDDAILHERK